MLISNDALIDLVLTARCHAVGQRDAPIQIMVSSLRQPSVLADSNSPSSQSLRSLLDKHHCILDTALEKALSKLIVMAVDGPLCDAIATVHDGRQVIVIFQGLLRLIRFHCELQLLISLLEREPSQLRIDESTETMPIGLAASVAGHAMMCASLDHGHLLVDLSHLLGPVARQRADYGYGAAVAFLLLHELGHHHCGHLGRGYLSEQAVFDLPLPETGGYQLQIELEADAFALNAFLPEYRSVLMSSIVFAMGPFAFMESFSGPRNPTSHPLTANRLAVMGRHASTLADEPVRKAIHSIIDAELERYSRLTADRASSDGDITAHIAQNMPLDEAYRWLSAIGQWANDQPAPPDFLTDTAAHQ